MSLILSKLLPPFFYPLGLTCLLLVMGLWALLIKPKDRPLSVARYRIAVFVVSLALVILLITSSVGFASSLMASLESQFPSLNDGQIPKTDSIVVLGGGTRPKIPPRPWYEVNDAGSRILYGARLWKQGKAPLLIVSGGRAQWLGEGGNPEAEDMAAIAMEMGVPKDAIVQEGKSLNTYENAKYIKEILQKRKLKKILLVTSAWHMPRSVAIFKQLGIDVVPAPTHFNVVKSQNDKGFAGTFFDLLPNADALRQTTIALKEIVGWFVYRWFGWA